MANLREKDDLLKGDEQGNERVRNAAGRERERQAAAGEGSHDDLGRSPEERAAETKGLEDNFSRGGDKTPRHGGLSRNIDGGRALPAPLAKIGSGLLSRARKRKKTLIAGGILGSVLSAFIAFLIAFLPLFQLVHMRELLDEHFGKRHDRTVVNRVGKHWRVVADKNGNIVYQRTGNPLRDRLYNTKSSKIVEDLQKRGFTATIDPSTGKIMLDGQPAAGKLSDRRADVRRQLDQIYPHGNYLRRSVRAARVFRIYGIKRTFFENTREKVDDWELRMKKKLRERLFVGGTDGLLRSDPNRQGTPTEAQAVEDQNLSEFDSKINEEAAKLKREALADPSKPIGNIDASAKLDDVAKNVASGVGKGALLGPVGIADSACEAIYLSRNIEVGAEALRSTSLARHTGTALVAADQLKTGDQVTGGEYNAFMKFWNGWGSSGAVKRISGVSDTAPIKGHDKFSVSGGHTGTLKEINERLSPYAAPCPVVTNIFFQAGAAIAVIAANVFTLGGVTLANIGTSVAASALIAGVTAVLTPLAIQMVAGMTVTGDETPEEKGDALVAGADVLYNQRAKLDGGRLLSGAEVTSLNSTMAHERSIDDRERGLAYRLFDTGNPRSLVMKTAYALPTTSDQIINGTGTYLASILSADPARIASALKPSSGLVSNAVANTHDTGSMFGVKQYGFTDDETEHYVDILANEDWVLQRKDKYLEYVRKCLAPDTGVVAYEDREFCNPAKPSAAYEEQLRFRLYRLDKGIAEGISFMTGSEASLATDTEGNVTPAPGGSTSPATGASPTLPPDDDTGEVIGAPAPGGTTGGGGPLPPPGSVKFGVSTAQMTCAAGVDKGVVGTFQGHQIRICEVQGITVNASIAAQLDALLNASRAAGIPLTGSGWRSYQRQVELYRSKPGLAAKPGTSRHEEGIAIDFAHNGKTICYHLGRAPSSRCAGHPAWDWLNANSKTYGLINLKDEAWHFSADGR